MIIKRKYVLIETLMDNDKYSHKVIVDIIDSFGFSSVKCYDLFQKIKDKRLFELKNSEIIKRAMYNVLIEKFDELDAFYPYNNCYLKDEVTSSEVIKEEKDILTIALLKPETEFSPVDYVCVLNVKIDKFGYCKLI